MIIITLRNQIKNSKKIVIKVGTNTLTKRDNSFNAIVMDRLAAQITGLRKQGKEILLVASGAIGLGMNGKTANRDYETLKQCYAAIGQNIMMRYITECFSSHAIAVSQVLVNHKDLLGDENEHIEEMISALLEMGILPVINQNDAISKHEITKYDNDTLSANIANLTRADVLIMLTDVDGLYRDDNTKEIISHVSDLNSEIYNCIGLSNSELGRGGMRSKVNAAQIMNKETIIANGSTENIIYRILLGEDVGTYFCLNRGEKNENWIDRSRESREIHN